MSELTNLLSLYQENPKKFSKAVKKATKKKLDDKQVIFEAREALLGYEANLMSGALRYTRNMGEILSTIRLGKHLIGSEVYRIWNGGKNGKICSKVVVKSITIQENIIYLETQAGYSAGAKEPVVRKLDMADFEVTWFLSEEDCKKAIERM